jgi:purine-nucleoside phosphorylase
MFRNMLEQALEVIHRATSLKPKLGIILGSGLGRFASSLSQAAKIPYNDLAGFPISTAIGHAGELVIGTIESSGNSATPVAVLSGRFHLYEGYTAGQAAAGIELFRGLGIERVVLTCAAGGLNEDFAEGALVLITDHINLQGVNPLVGRNDDSRGPRFPDMTEAYSKRLRILAHNTADEIGVTLHDGVYAAMLGPSYETPAEIRFLKKIGADLVGMSVVAETISANHGGMEVLGIACVTNLAAGISGQKLVHSEVLQVTERVSATFQSLLTTLVPRIAGPE